MANLGINPKNLDEQNWAKRYAQALWIERMRLKNQADMLTAMWGG
ncbi:MAG: hypothetical protein ACRC9X_05200 [Bacteroidales bacterium]